MTELHSFLAVLAAGPLDPQPDPSTPARVTEACGASPGLVCETVLDWTDNRGLAKAGSWLADRPFRVLVILAVAWVIVQVVKRMVGRLVHKWVSEINQPEDSAITKLARKGHLAMRPDAPVNTSLRAAARAETIGLVASSAAAIIIWTVAVLMALAELSLNVAPLVASAGIVGVALGFGAQSLVADFLSGLFMLAEDQYGVGDVIDVGGADGVVERVNLRTTRLRSVDGTVWHVPNGEIRRVGNKSQQWARALLDVEVAYDTDLGHAETVVKEVADAMWVEEPWSHLILEEPEVWGIEDLGADGIAIRLVVKTRPGEQWTVARAIRRRLKDRFDAEGIEIPFPQRTLWVKRDEGSSRDGESATL